MKRKKLELTITIIIYFAAALLSGFLAIGVLQGVQKLTTTFLNENILVAAIFPLLTAEIFAMVFTLYDGRYAFQHMSFIACAMRAIKSTAVVAGIWAGILLIEKNSITESRYYFVTALMLNAIFLKKTCQKSEKAILWKQIHSGIANGWMVKLAGKVLNIL